MDREEVNVKAMKPRRGKRWEEKGIKMRRRNERTKKTRKRFTKR